MTNFICNLITEASNQLKHMFTLHFRFKISFSFELVGFQNCRIPNTNCKREREGEIFYLSQQELITYQKNPYLKDDV